MPHDELFDLAMNRAAAYAARLGALEPLTSAAEAPERAVELRRALELWYLRTRFAYRVPLDDVVARLLAHPGGEAHWLGGAAGGWRPGATPRP